LIGRLRAAQERVEPGVEVQPTGEFVDELAMVTAVFQVGESGMEVQRGCQRPDVGPVAATERLLVELGEQFDDIRGCGTLLRCSSRAGAPTHGAGRP
jgi:hypothetical protein